MSFKVEFKDDIHLADFMIMQKNCKLLLEHFMVYCSEHELRCRITSLVSDREGVISKSNTHASGRAFDASVRGWTTDEIDDCVIHFNNNFANIAAISNSDKKPRACVYHNSGYGTHLHFQVRPDGV